jgi:CHAT domain-containing protein
LALTRCLCLTLTLSMLGLRPSAVVRTGSPEPGRWWGTTESSNLRRTAHEFFAAGNFRAAEPVCQRGFELADHAHDPIAAARFLMTVAAARLGEFHYGAALDAYLQARRRALAAGDLADAAAIEASLSILYLQIWDLESSLHASQQARSEGEFLMRRDHSRPYFETSLLLQLGRLHEILRDGEAEGLYREGVEAARREGNVALEAKGWDYAGETRMAAGDLAGAEWAHDQAFRLRSLFDHPDLPMSWAFEGALNLAQGNFAIAAKFTDRAIASAAVVDSSFPLYLLMHQRGEIRAARGDKDGALADFGAAVELASRWRQEIPPSISSLTAANIGLENRVFDSFIEAAAERALRGRDSRWVERSLAALERNRSHSLHETLSFIGTWRSKLWPEYWEAQGQLRAESARLVRTGQIRSSESDRLELELTEMESETKLQISNNKPEIFSPQGSLIHIQGGLSRAEVLLIFHLGKPASYLWAVTADRAALHRLPGAEKLRAEVEAFRESVRRGEPDADARGAAVYAQLFGALSPEVAGRKTWLLSVDDALFDLPFGALVTEQKDHVVKYLVEEHALEVIPGALLLSRGAGKPDANGWFLGVGDPIYNAADPRIEASRPHFSGWLAQAAPSLQNSGVQPARVDPLGRLVGSGPEVELSARNWTGASGRGHIVLRGADALRSRFVDLAGRGPAVIHLATHVLAPPGGPDHAMIAFGDGPAGEPEFLGASEIATMRVPGALVVLSGCETGAGSIRPGAGLLGLTRAWQLAGASAVVATAWPVADSTGAIFASFYRNLSVAGPAEALERSQIEMLRSGTWRARPSYWAAYQLSGGIH